MKKRNDVKKNLTSIGKDLSGNAFKKNYRYSRNEGRSGKFLGFHFQILNSTINLFHHLFTWFSEEFNLSNEIDRFAVQGQLIGLSLPLIVSIPCKC